MGRLSDRPDAVDTTSPLPDRAVSDARLVAGVAAGDEAAVSELYRRYGARLYGFGLQRLADERLAEELVQDVFVRLWRSASRYDPGLSSVTSFLFLLARRAVIDQRRGADRRPVLSDREVPEGTSDPTDPGRAHDQALVDMEVRAAVARLPDHHRETLRLQLDDGLTVREVAEHMGVPVGTAKSRRFHALRELKTQLEERGLVG